MNFYFYFCLFLGLVHVGDVAFCIIIANAICLRLTCSMLLRTVLGTGLQRGRIAVPLVDQKGALNHTGVQEGDSLRYAAYWHWLLAPLPVHSHSPSSPSSACSRMLLGPSS